LLNNSDNVSNDNFGYLSTLGIVCLIILYRYLLWSLWWLTTGHFGCVYHALLLEDDKSEKEVAVKTMRIPSG